MKVEHDLHESARKRYMAPEDLAAVFNNALDANARARDLEVTAGTVFGALEIIRIHITHLQSKAMGK